MESTEFPASIHLNCWVVRTPPCCCCFQQNLPMCSSVALTARATKDHTSGALTRSAAEHVEEHLCLDFCSVQMYVNSQWLNISISQDGLRRSHTSKIILLWRLSITTMLHTIASKYALDYYLSAAIGILPITNQLHTNTTRLKPQHDLTFLYSNSLLDQCPLRWLKMPILSIPATSPCLLWGDMCCSRLCSSLQALLQRWAT